MIDDKKRPQIASRRPKMSTRNIVETAIDLSKGHRSTTWEGAAIELRRTSKEEIEDVLPPRCEECEK